MQSNNQTTNVVKPKPLYQYKKSFIIPSFLVTYGIILILCTCLIGYRNLEHAQVIGLIVNGSIIIAGSMIFSVINIIFRLEKITWYDVAHRKLWAMTHKEVVFLLSILPLGFIPIIFLLRYHKKITATSEIIQKAQLHPIFIITAILFFLVLTIWVVYAIMGNKLLDSGDPKNPYVVPGFLDIFKAPVDGFVDGADIIIFLLCIGAFLQVVNSSKALDAGVGAIATKLKGKEIMIIPIIMIVFSTCGAVFGFCEETLGFYALIMPLILAAGFDSIVGLTVIVLGAGLGCVGSVVNPFAIVTTIDATEASTGVQMSMSSGIVMRMAIWILCTAIGIIYITWYARKVKNNPKLSLVYSLGQNKKDFELKTTVPPEFTFKRKVILGIFCSAFVLLVIGCVPWEDLTGWTGFEQFNNWLIHVFPFITTNVGAIGTWYLDTFCFLFLIGALVVQIINWNGVDNFIKEIIVGCKEFMGVALVIAVARGLSLIITSSGISTPITGAISTVLSINHVLGSLLLFIVLFAISCLITSSSGFAYSIYGPFVAPAMHAAGYSLSAGMNIGVFANQFSNLITPASGPFVIGCSLAKVDIKYYYKFVWKLMLILTVVIIGAIMVGVYLPDGVIN